MFKIPQGGGGEGGAGDREPEAFSQEGGEESVCFVSLNTGWIAQGQQIGDLYLYLAMYYFITLKGAGTCRDC